jgi:transcriptional regulator
MYLPPHFAEQNITVLQAFIHDHPFASLVVQTTEGIVANHIPLELDPHSGEFGTLRGHIARANPLWQIANLQQQALVLFNGADAYITPSWYPSKQASGRVVPTWDYVAVHAYGSIGFVEDAAWLHALVSRLTNRHEAAQTKPWTINDAPTEYVDKLLGAIVGVEIPISRLLGKWKVSQNKSAADRAGVIAGLQAQGGEPALEMARLVAAFGQVQEQP